MLSIVDHGSAWAEAMSQVLNGNSLCADTRFRDGRLNDPGIQDSAQSMRHQQSCGDARDAGPEGTLVRGSVRRKWHMDILCGQCILGTRVRLLEYLSPRLYEAVDSTYACVSTYLDVVYIAADGRLLCHAIHHR